MRNFEQRINGDVASLGSPIFVYFNFQILECPYFQTFRYSDSYVFKFSNFQTFESFNSRTLEFPNFGKY